MLKTGGRLVVGFFGRDSAWWRFYAEEALKNPNSTFNCARFYTLDELLAVMPGKNVQGKAVLFIPPDFNFNREAEAMALEAAAVQAGRTDGGFLCAVSVK